MAVAATLAASSTVAQEKDSVATPEIKFSEPRTLEQGLCFFKQENGGSPLSSAFVAIIDRPIKIRLSSQDTGKPFDTDFSIDAVQNSIVFVFPSYALSILKTPLQPNLVPMLMDGASDNKTVLKRLEPEVRNLEKEINALLLKCYAAHNKTL